MRRLTGLAIAAVAAVVIAPVAVAQTAGPTGSSSEQVCVTLIGAQPSGGWTSATLKAAIADGTVAVGAIVPGPTSCGDLPATSEPTIAATEHQVSVTIQVTDSFPAQLVGQTDCRGIGGYSDLAPGLQILVKDATGTILGVGAIDRGTRSRVLVQCDFTGTVANVPDADIYQVEIGQRGAVTFTRDQLETEQWHVVLTIGD